MGCPHSKDSTPQVLVQNQRRYNKLPNYYVDARSRAMGASNKVVPVVSKIFCSPSQATLVVRKRPRVVNGGGFVVLNGHHNVVFSVDGCGTLGVKGELVVRDGDGGSILLIRKKGGIVQALSAYDRWKGYLSEFGASNRSVFSLKEPRSCLVVNNSIRISVERNGYNKDWDFEVIGSFLEKNCIIQDRKGNIVAKVGGKEMMAVASKDFYHVVVQPGYDQAFVVGVIAILDNIHGESTRC